ncbi:MAG: TPM domain-containing protein [Flavobacteriia bacterium]|nr:TPM domain-containing protein [Flavobacteriia bacterium]OJX37138.1 MAG: hypothetical protein BGO87_15370 [Flavobacteriia bacterium 40-80]
MNKLLLFFFLICPAISQLFAAELEVPDRPHPQRMVNIFSRQPFLNAREISVLEQKLVAFSDSTSNQIAIVVVDDLNGLTANEYATELGQKWGVGQKKLDNGIIILLSLGGGEGNRDYYIAVGYGLEGAIPDLAVKRVQESELLPYLKSGNYYEALDRTTNVLMALAKGEIDSKEYAKKSNEDEDAGIVLLIFFGIIAFFIWLAIKNKNQRPPRGGSGWGSFIGSGLGAILGSGGGYGSSGSSGGFGGFGGGSFGGGGAGGKW